MTGASALVANEFSSLNTALNLSHPVVSWNTTPSLYPNAALSLKHMYLDFLFTSYNIRLHELEHFPPQSSQLKCWLSETLPKGFQSPAKTPSQRFFHAECQTNPSDVASKKLSSVRDAELVTLLEAVQHIYIYILKDVDFSTMEDKLKQRWNRDHQKRQIRCGFLVTQNQQSLLRVVIAEGTTATLSEVYSLSVQDKVLPNEA